MKHLLLVIAGCATAAFPIADAAAQGLGTVRVRAGLGAQVRPEWRGADESEVTLYPSLSVATGDKPFGISAPDDSFDLSLIKKDGFSAGPVFDLRRGRKNSDVGAPVGKVPRTFEAGVFVQQFVSDSVRLRGEVRQGIGGHEGLMSSLGADYIWHDGERYAVSLGPRLLVSNGRFQREFFGVTPEAALASGLPVYRPDGGIHAVAATSGLDYALGGGWGLFGYARYERLVGDARKSPIVREFGSPDQFSVGLGLNHTFTLRL
jgi:outer membrane protein